MQVNLKVPESKVDYVTPGMRAVVTVDAFPLATLRGTVTSVSPLPDATSMSTWDNKVYTTKVRIEEGPPALRHGMTARVEIKLAGELENVLTVPNHSVIRIEGEDRVAVKLANGGFEWRALVLGASNGSETEVRSGLQSGALVALRPDALLTDAQKRQIAASPTLPAGPRGENTNPTRRPGSR
jgi:multidrug efflux pump subunit AcrA (membrane-fusion protein)